MHALQFSLLLGRQLGLASFQLPCALATAIPSRVQVALELGERGARRRKEDLVAFRRQLDRIGDETAGTVVLDAPLVRLSDEPRSDGSDRCR